MSAETDFRTRLAGHAALAALVGTRIALNAVPQDSALPVVVFTSRHDPSYTLDNTLAADFVTFDVQCWSQTSVQASAVADAVDGACAAARAAGDSAIVVSRASAYDAEQDLHAEIVTVEWLD